MTDGLEVFDETQCVLGEGPGWDARTGEVFWLDIEGCGVHFRSLSSGSATRTVATPSRVGAAMCRTAGGHLVSLADGPAVMDGADLRPVARWLDAPGAATVPVRGNDAKCDPRGRAFLGTMELEEPRSGRAALYRLDPGADALVLVEPGASISNGLGWSPDATRMYYIDTPTRRVDRFDYDLDSGTPTARSTFVEIPDGAGDPDGMTVEADGCIWVALWDGSAVRRYTPDGRLDRVVELPCPQVTSCAFVGEALDLLVITTAREGLADPPREAGMTFCIDPGVTGLPVAAYAG